MSSHFHSDEAIIIHNRRALKSEPEVWKIVKHGGGIFVDVGANFGEYSRRVWRKYRTIIAVEPNPEAFETLRSRYGWRSLFSNFIPYQCAASDHDGTDFLYLNQDKVRCNGSADTIEPVFNYRPASHPEINRTWDYSQGSIVKKQVKTRRLDTLLEWTKGIDLLKVDVEGAEFRVLRGSSGILESVMKIIVELHDRERTPELETVLDGWNFTTRWLDPDHILGER